MFSQSPVSPLPATEGHFAFSAGPEAGRIYLSNAFISCNGLRKSQLTITPNYVSPLRFVFFLYKFN